MKWKSKQMYEHPAEYQKNVFGTIEQSEAGIYSLKVGGSRMSCPQEWASLMHKLEQDETKLGRPKIGDLQLPTLTVPIELKEALEKKAFEIGLSLPDARREAYRILIGK